MHWKTKGRLAGIALLACSFVSANGTLVFGKAAASDPVVKLVSFNPTIAEAEATARAQFADFLEFVAADQTPQSVATIKIAVPTDDGTEEVIWVENISDINGVLIGRVTEPSRPLRLSKNDAIALSPEQVRDWSYVGPNGKLFGNYTTRALLPTLSPDSAARIAAVLSVNPLPADW